MTFKSLFLPNFLYLKQKFLSLAMFSYLSYFFQAARQFYFGMQADSPLNDNLSLQKSSTRRKALSDRPVRKDDRVLWRHRGINQPVPEMITYLLMKQKFQKMYKKIEKLSTKDEEIINNYHKNMDKQTMLQSSVRIIHLFERDSQPQVCKIKTSHLYPKHSLPIEGELLINTANTMNGGDQSPVSRGSPIKLAQILRKSRYQKKMLQPMKNKLSNNIKDYLSVQKISIKEISDPLALQKSKMQRQYNISNLLALKTSDRNELEDKLKRYQSTQLKQEISAKAENLMLKRNLKFKVPFQLYNYRDFMWQVAFSNGVIVEPVQEYESKIKFYVGAGNNSNLIKGIMNRRPWYTLTDKAQDANFVWTQIKIITYFSLQTKRQKLPHINEQEMHNYLSQTKEANTLNESKKKQKQNTLLNHIQQSKWQQYWKVNIDRERKIKESLKGRSRYFNINETNISKIRAEVKIHNHFPNNFIIGNKKALFKTMSEYSSSLNKDVFQYLPLTFHIKNGLEDDEYLKFLQYFYALNKSAKNDENSINKYNAWIVKPGENTNRGNGIIVCLELNQIKNILKKQEKHADGTLKTYILQKYIERPLLYKKRKFDLRHYMMLNCAHGRMKGYWYREGYVRTTSTEYTLKISNGSVHLTNDAVQKNLPDYGKYEKGNKIYYEELEQFIKKQDPNFDFWKMIYPRMKQIATDVIHASALNIDPQRRVNNFQIFGLDFMIDSNYNVWLIEVNTNPCLETACPVLNKIIPKFVENTFQICIDPVFPAPLGFAPKYNKYLQNLKEENNFQLVFDERIDGAKSIGQSVLATGVQQQDDVFDDDGQDFDQAN